MNKPASVPEKPSYTAADVTVVVTTVDISHMAIHAVVRSILEHEVKALIITTAGSGIPAQISSFNTVFRDQRILLLHRAEPNQHEQTAAAMKHVTTRLLVLSNDHTYWPSSPRFLPSLLAPFEDPKVGAVSPITPSHSADSGTSGERFISNNMAAR
ncbi:glycosyltransferase family 2 protein [Trematosphaeria pertusa]|uniref:Glycosyltransferase family 2 protein n=1 Tax=Trematosphaeria pertusa TaxID=390896 RepID=A0A6A6J1J1_9PLEO|nr:glycosyltransferase family 2 protein [Trematosphaeria pertusa]KAF2256735.1 glycosyltransferase family 2 protein [Trematosphaeria pertusa]